MEIGEVAGLIVLLSVVIWGSGEIYDFIKVRQGIFPKKAETTLSDIKRMRDAGHDVFAVRRFRQMPENRGLYTLRGAQKIVDQL